MAEATLNEKVLELAIIDRRAISAKRTRELAEQKVESLQGKLKEAKTKLAEAASIVLAHDKELADLKETMKMWEQVFYNIGFNDTKNSASVLIFQAQRLGFSEGWMAPMNAIGLPEYSALGTLIRYPCPMIRPFRPQPKSNLMRKVIKRGRIAPAW